MGAALGVAGGGADHRLGLPHGTDAALYDATFVPPMHEARLARLAERLLEGAQWFESVEAAPTDERTDERADEPADAATTEAAALLPPSPSERMRRLAGELHRYRAALLGRRWDPRAADALDAAERLLGEDEVRPLREALAFFHGDWERTKEARDRDRRNLSRIYLGEAPEDGFQVEVSAERDLGLRMLSPNDLRAEHDIASLYLDSDLSASSAGGPSATRSNR